MCMRGYRMVDIHPTMLYLVVWSIVDVYSYFILYYYFRLFNKYTYCITTRLSNITTSLTNKSP